MTRKILNIFYLGLEIDLFLKKSLFDLQSVQKIFLIFKEIFKDFGRIIFL